MILVVACLFALFTMAKMSTGVALPQSLFRVSTWWKAMRWTIGLTAFGTIAAVVTFGQQAATATIVLGGAAIFLEGGLMSYAAFWPRD